MSMILVHTFSLPSRLHHSSHLFNVYTSIFCRQNFLNVFLWSPHFVLDLSPSQRLEQFFAASTLSTSVWSENVALKEKCFQRYFLTRGHSQKLFMSWPERNNKNLYQIIYDDGRFANHFSRSCGATTRGFESPNVTLNLKYVYTK